MSLLLLYEGYMGNIYDMSAFGGNGPRNTLCILTKGLLGPIPYNMVSHLSDEALAWCDPQGYVTPKSDSDWDYEAQIDEYYRPLAVSLVIPHLYYHSDRQYRLCSSMTALWTYPFIVSFVTC